jgi:hypothetical protein
MGCGQMSESAEFSERSQLEHSRGHDLPAIDKVHSAQ